MIWGLKKGGSCHAMYCGLFYKNHGPLLVVDYIAALNIRGYQAGTLIEKKYPCRVVSLAIGEHR